jgi:hypothetical protein
VKKLFLRSIHLLAVCAALLAIACGEDGTTTKCENMPDIAKPYGADPPTAEELKQLEDWRADAVVEGCATKVGDVNDHPPDDPADGGP